MHTLRERVRTIVFESETGRAFDAIVNACILASVIALFLDSIPAMHRAHADVLYGIEWFFTILFTVEYAVRLWCVDRPLAYARSFYGVVDLVGALPTYASSGAC